jgi:hypothetical protein
MAKQTEPIIQSGQEIIEAFESIGKYVESDIGPTFLKGVTIIVALFALIRIGKSAIGMITNPESDSSWFTVLLKPILLMLFILFYNSVIKLTDASLGLTNKIIPGDPLIELNEYLHKRANETVAGGYVPVRSIGRGGSFTYREEVGPDMSTEDEKIVEDIFGAVDKENPINNSIDLGRNDITEGLQILITWLGTVIRTIMMGLRQLLLTILKIGGPLAILISFIPTLEKSAAQWFGMYVHTFLWLPISKIIDTFVLVTSKALVLGDQHGMVFFLLECVLVVAYFYLPKITSFFVASKDGGGVMSTMGMAAFSAFKQIRNKVGQTAVAAGGAASTLKDSISTGSANNSI